jgi:hypothetical protein
VRDYLERYQHLGPYRCPCCGCADLAPLVWPPGKHIDLCTGIFPVSEWGPECTRGFVRDERFARAGDRVIKPTSRDVVRSWRQLDQ